jgi:ketosteroid isomerase-like protein
LANCQPYRSGDNDRNRVAKKLKRNDAPAELQVTDELNRQRILNMLEIYYSGDLEGTLARCTDDVEFFSNAPVDILPHLGAHRGKAEVRAMWETIYLRYSEMRHEVPIIVAEGDKVAVLIRLFLRKRNNNRMVQFDIAVFYTLRDGRVCQIREVMDTFDVVEQVLEKDLSAVLTGKPVGER